MKKLLLISIAAYLLFALNMEAGEKWVKTKGPYGADIKAIQMDNKTNVIYLATGTNGIFSSTNKGNTWVSVMGNNDAAIQYINDMLVDDNGDLYCVTDSMGIFRKIAGSTWKPINTGFGGYLNFKCILKIDNNTFLAGSNGKAIFKTTNNGESWSNYYDGISKTAVINSMTKLKSGIFIGTTDGLYRSSNGGRQWFKVDVKMGTVNKFHFVADKDMLLAATSNGIFVSYDFGFTWSKLYNGLANNINVLSISVKQDKIFIGTEFKGLYYCFIDSFEWQPIENNLNASKIQVMENIDNNLFIGTNYSLFRDIELGIVPANNGIDVKSVNNFINLNGSVYAATDRGVFRTDKFGYEWVQLNNGFRDVFNICSLINAQNGSILAGTDGDGLYISYDAGLNWIKNTNPELTSIRINKLVKDSTGVIYAGTRGKGVFKSEDNGETWVQMHGANLEITDVLSLIVAYDNYIYAGTASNGLYRKAPYEEWRNLLNVGVGITSITSLEYKKVEGSGALFAGTNFGIIRSLDNGNIWTKTNGLLLSQAKALYLNGTNNQTENVVDTLFAGLKNVNGVYISIDNGENWSSYIDDSGINSFTVSSFIGSDAGFIFTGTKNGGCYRSLLSAFGEQPIHPKIVSLGENSFCDGGLCILDAGESNNKVQWSNGCTTRFDTIKIEGNYWFSYKDLYGIPVLSDTVAVTVYPNPGKPNVFFADDLLVCSIAADSYRWFLNNQEIPGANEQTYKPAESGNYKCEVRTVHNCTDISEEFRVQLLDVTTADIDNGIIIYPNPSDGYLNIENINGIGRIEILNSLGNVVFAKEINNFDNKAIELDLNNVENGFYFIRISSANKIEQEKLIIAR